MSTPLSSANDLQSQLYGILKKLVVNATSELKNLYEAQTNNQHNSKAAVPISFLPADEAGSGVLQMLEEKYRVRQPKCATIPVGEMSISFQLPADFPLHQIDVEKLVPPERETTSTNRSMRQFSFFERLKGWKIEVRRRKNNPAFDSYFHHEKLKKVLRSYMEVVGFILYEDTTAVQSEKRKTTSLPKEESTNKRIKVEMKESAQL